MLTDATSILTALGALAAVLVLIWLAARAARFGGIAPRPAQGRSLAVLEVIALDTRRRLHLVRYKERRVLLLTGGPQDVVVSSIERDESTP